MESVQPWAPSICCSTFWGPECLIPLQTSFAASVEAHTTPWYKRCPWEWQPSVDPLRSTGLGPAYGMPTQPSAIHSNLLLDRNCLESDLGGCHQPGSCVARFVHILLTLSILPMESALHRGCDSSQCLARAFAVENRKQNKALCHPWLSFLTLLPCQKLSLVNSVSFCKSTQKNNLLTIKTYKQVSIKFSRLSKRT